MDSRSKLAVADTMTAALTTVRIVRQTTVLIHAGLVVIGMTAGAEGRISRG